MIVLRDKEFIFNNMTAAVNLARAGNYAAAVKPALKSVGTMAAYTGAAYGAKKGFDYATGKEVEDY